jgi:hypothetical protein
MNNNKKIEQSKLTNHLLYLLDINTIMYYFYETDIIK